MRGKKGSNFMTVLIAISAFLSDSTYLSSDLKQYTVQFILGRC